MIDLWFAESPVALDTSVGYVVAQNMAILKEKNLFIFVASNLDKRRLTS